METERYLEDLHVGDRFNSGPYEVTEAGIINFAREFDPQPFFTSMSSARG